MMAPPLPLSKWTKYELLSACPDLQTYLPQTRRFAVAELPEFVRTHGAVVIKPEWGEGGHYVCKVVKRARGYTVHTGTRLVRCATSARLAASLPPFTREKRCIMQRLVQLRTIRQRPVDIRTIVQRNEQGLFEVTGTFIKVAPKWRFVTNVKQGGTIGDTDRYLRNCVLNPLRRQAVRATIWQVSERIGHYLGEQFSNSVYGIDLGLDDAGKVWIIEVNTQPNLGILGKLDTKMRQRAFYLRRYNRAQKRVH